MDFLKQAQGALGGAAGGQQQQQPQQGAVDPNAQQQQQGGAVPAGGAAPVAGGATGQQDYLDKAVGMGAKQFGYNADVATTEKISDGLRSAYKSATGKDIPIEDKQ